MARRVVYHTDGSSETWDDDAGTYTKQLADGVTQETRDLSTPELDALDPYSIKLRKLNRVVNQLLLDMLGSKPSEAVSDRLLDLRKKGKLTDLGIDNAVLKGWITLDQGTKLKGVKPTPSP